METSIIKFTADKQNLRVDSGVMRYASETVNYVQAEFNLGKGWESFAVIKAVWKNSRTAIATGLDNNNTCIVPNEMLQYKSAVQVNLVGYDMTENEITARLTTYPVIAIEVDRKAEVEGADTKPITPSQFDTFVANVADNAAIASAARIEALQYAQQAEEAKLTAIQMASNANDSATAADTSAQHASDYASDAEAAKVSAEISADSALNSESAAALSAAQASASASQAMTSATSASESASEASASEANASDSAASASDSATAAADSATAAADSAVAAAESESTVETWKTLAESAATNASNASSSARTARDEAVAAKDRMLSKLTVSQTEPENPQEGDVWITYRVKYAVSYAYTGEVPENAPALPEGGMFYPGVYIRIADKPTLEGYIFSGWSPHQDFTMPEHDVEITGSWAAEEVEPTESTE